MTDAIVWVLLGCVFLRAIVSAYEAWSELEQRWSRRRSGGER